MSRDNLNSNLRIKLDNNPPIKGLSKFKKDLERSYFSKTTVRDCYPKSEGINLVIEMDCPISLLEMSRSLKDGNWARTQTDLFTGIPISPLDTALSELQLLNDTLLDVEEFSIFLEDCSIIIKKIYEQSIREQLVGIFNAFSDHLSSLTKKFREVPYEIYIPVFEEDLLDNEIKIASIEQAKNNRKDYFKYWGLYFDYQEDAVIYELSEKRIISGDLFMLSH